MNKLQKLLLTMIPALLLFFPTVVAAEDGTPSNGVQTINESVNIEENAPEVSAEDVQEGISRLTDDSVGILGEVLYLGVIVGSFYGLFGIITGKGFGRQGRWGAIFTLLACAFVYTFVGDWTVLLDFFSGLFKNYFPVG